MESIDILTELNKVMNIIDAVEAVLVSGLGVKKKELQKTYSAVLNIFPDIVELYEANKIKKELIPLEYWQQQMDRILETLEVEDYFRWIDILVFETRAALEEVPKML